MEDKAGYTTSIHKLVRDEVSLHMRPFIEVTMREHQDTRDEVIELKCLIQAVNKINVHDVLQYGGIILLFLAMLVLPTCA